MAIGIRELAKDLGVEYDGGVRLNTDANAAIGISNRVGSRQVRHMEVNQSWLQEKVRKKEMEVVNVPTDDHLTDALRKGVESGTLTFHVQGVVAEIRRDRHDLAPKTEYEKSEELEA